MFNLATVHLYTEMQQSKELIKNSVRDLTISLSISMIV